MCILLSSLKPVMLVMSLTTLCLSCAFTYFTFKLSRNELVAIISELVICLRNCLLNFQSLRLQLVRHQHIVLDILGYRPDIEVGFSISDSLKVCSVSTSCFLCFTHCGVIRCWVILLGSWGTLGSLSRKLRLELSDYLCSFLMDRQQDIGPISLTSEPSRTLITLKGFSLDLRLGILPGSYSWEGGIHMTGGCRQISHAEVILCYFRD